MSLSSPIYSSGNNVQRVLNRLCAYWLFWRGLVSAAAGWGIGR